MIAAILMGKEKSTGFPGKNLYHVLGKPLVTYPIAAALGSQYVDHLFITTDSPDIMKIAEVYQATVIKRPPELCTPEALGEDVFVHAASWITEQYGQEPEIIVLLMANAATITSKLIDEGIEALRNNASLDSAISVSRYNMWSPLRARRLDEEGLLQPFVPFDVLGKKDELSDNRDSQGDVYFADMGVSVIRPRNLKNIKDGLLPQRWMGRRLYPLKQWGGFDVDYEWQIPMLEYWLRKNEVRVPEPNEFKSRVRNAS